MRERGGKRNKAKVSWKTNFKRENVHEQRTAQEAWSSNHALALKQNFKELKNFVYTLWMTQQENKLGQCRQNKLTKNHSFHWRKMQIRRQSQKWIHTKRNVMQRTLWMAPTFCIATMAFGTLAFPRARVCTHSVLTRSWLLNYHYHLEKVGGLLMYFHWTSLFSFVAPCTDPGLIDRGKRNGTDFSHGQVVTYECSTKNYSLVGNPRRTCNDGVWDSALPVCKSEYPKIYIF